jgi:hypothetical protein
MLADGVPLPEEVVPLPGEVVPKLKPRFGGVFFFARAATGGKAAVRLGAELFDFGCSLQKLPINGSDRTGGTAL